MFEIPSKVLSSIPVALASIVLLSACPTNDPPVTVADGGGGEDECTKPSDCPVGQQCVGGSCQDPPPCEKDRDCRSGWQCIDGGCYPRDDNGGEDASSDVSPDASMPEDSGGADAADGFDPSDGSGSETGTDDVAGDAASSDARSDGGDAGGEQNCRDDADDDGNGLTDCADPSCWGRVCSSDGRVCTPSEECTCSQTEQKESTCDDGVDNDCDQVVDCGDIDCHEKSCDPANPQKTCDYLQKKCTGGD